MSKLTSDDRDDLKIWARLHVRGGFEEVEDIEELLLELVGEFETSLSERDLRFEVREAVIAAVESLLEDQAKWDVLTDYDRLELAFDQLEDAGIVARQNFTCCGTCGAAEIQAEIEDFEFEGRTARGYVFFHQQDTERAVEGSGLYFSYGSVEDGSEAAHLAIGQQVHDTMAAVGLKPHWNGKIDQRVGVMLEWKRRWEGDVPAPLKRWMF